MHRLWRGYYELARMEWGANGIYLKPPSQNLHGGTNENHAKICSEEPISGSGLKFGV